MTSNYRVPRCFRWNDSAGKLQIPSSKLPPSVAASCAPKPLRRRSDTMLSKDAAVQLLRRTGQISPKPQTSTRRSGWLPHRSGVGLQLEIWSLSGAWSLGLGALMRAVIHRKQRRTILYPGDRQEEIYGGGCPCFRTPGALSTSMARNVAALRVSTPSFSKMSKRCFFTVDSLMPRMVAMSPLVLP